MRLLALLLALLIAAPALADDAPRRMSLEPAASSTQPSFDAAQHPVIAAVAISGAVAIALAIVVGVVFSTSRAQYPYPTCPGCREG